MNRQSFLEARRSGIGSSDSPRLAGVSPFGGPLQVWEEKVGPVEDEQTTPQRWGLAFEDAIVKAWAVGSGQRIRRSPMRRSKSHPHLIANPDREVLGESALVEVKMVPFRAEDWGDPPSEVPDYTRVQALHQLAVTGRQRVYVPALFRLGHEPVEYVVERNERAIAEILTMGEEFWRDHVVPKVAPPPDGSDASRRSLLRRHPVDDGSEITATIELAAVVDQYLQARVIVAQAGDRKDELENIIRDAMGDASVLLAPEARITYKNNRDSTVVGWEEVAIGYRGMVEEMIPLLSPEKRDYYQKLVPGFEGLYTTTKAGARVFRVARGR